ncbi:MAG TPA: glycosyltransferase family 2 protein [Stellaceae bacterium]|nr:glycosyltransferase family 2 protein [Stellaceae bacterium]
MLPFATSFHYSQPLQQPFDAAVVIPTTCRPSLARAVRSVFRQTGLERIHVLLGVDVVRGDPAIVDALLAERPPNHAVTVLDLGYSTSVRHGGFYLSQDGGALRVMLTYAANSRYVAYLDDDNWLHESHLARLRAAIEGRDWAYTLRWYVDPETMEPLAIDRWESVGPGKGVFASAYGGFVDPNSLMVDKLRCEAAIAAWTIPMSADPRGRTADRTVFDRLRHSKAIGCTHTPTSYYLLNPSDHNSVARLGWLRRFRARVGAAALDPTVTPDLTPTGKTFPGQ